MSLNSFPRFVLMRHLILRNKFLKMFSLGRRRRRIRARRRSRPLSYKEYLAFREEARAFVHERIAFWNEHYACEIKRVAIRNSRSRWGSCSLRGNLNFSYKVLFLPPALADYIIVHELCHLREFSHSPVFWAHVAETLPNHKALRRHLRTIKLQELSRKISPNR